MTNLAKIIILGAISIGVGFKAGLVSESEKSKEQLKLSSGSDKNHKRSKEADYDDKYGKHREEKQEDKMREITINQVF